MRDAHDRRPDIRGFTMIEVMVALIITMIAMGLLFGGIVSALRAARQSVAWERAVSRAESRFAAIADPGQLLGERTGEDGEGYRWQTRVSFLGAAPAPPTAREGPWIRGTGLYAVSVTILWHDGRAERGFALDGARLGPVPGAYR